MKEVKYFTRIVLVVFLSVCLWSCLKPVPVDIVMIGNDVCFVLENEQEIHAVQVMVFDPAMGNRNDQTMWALRQDLRSEVKKRNYPRLKNIKYGQILEEFPAITGPAELKRNVEYAVGIDMGDKFAREVFMITDDNHIVMTHRNDKREHVK
jgi:hypothetical protein